MADMTDRDRDRIKDLICIWIAVALLLPVNLFWLRSWMESYIEVVAIITIGTVIQLFRILAHRRQLRR